MSRISRDDALMAIAEIMAKRGTCSRASVGAVIAIEGRIIATGYVGSPPGQPHCIDPSVGCEQGTDGGCIRTVHAEANSIAFAAASGVATRGATIYTTHSPCRNCAKLILTAAIRRVVFSREYRDRSGLELLEAAGVETETYRASVYAYQAFPWF